MSPPAVLASPSAWNDFLPWIALGLVVFALLFVAAVGVPRRRAARRNDGQAAEPAAAPAVRTPHEHVSTRHRHGRLVVRGTFAGRYLDVGDAGGHEAPPSGALFDQLRAGVADVPRAAPGPR